MVIKEVANEKAEMQKKEDLMVEEIATKATEQQAHYIMEKLIVQVADYVIDDEKEGVNRRVKKLMDELAKIMPA